MLESCLYKRPGFGAEIKWVKRGIYKFCNKCFLLFSHENALAEKENNHEGIVQQTERIFNDYGNSILRLAYSYLHSMGDAEEVLQETLIRFLKTNPVFENKSHEKAWLLRVASNLSKNQIKYNELRSTDELSDNLIADNRKDLSFVWEAVKALPVKYRKAIHLFYHEGYSSAQIAQILGKNESTVRSDLRRGRATLKKLLKEGYDFEESVQ